MKEMRFPIYLLEGGEWALADLVDLVERGAQLDPLEEGQAQILGAGPPRAEHWGYYRLTGWVGRVRRIEFEAFVEDLPPEGEVGEASGLVLDASPPPAGCLKAFNRQLRRRVVRVWAMGFPATSIWSLIGERLEGVRLYPLCVTYPGGRQSRSWSIAFGADAEAMAEAWARRPRGPKEEPIVL